MSSVSPNTGEPTRQQLAALVEQVEGELKRWLVLAARLEEELGQPEPDAGIIARLLTERNELHQRLVQWTERAPAETWRGHPRLRELAEAIVATDRESAERAQAIRSECLRRLDEVRRRRAMAAGYRRTLQSAFSGGPLVCDKQV